MSSSVTRWALLSLGSCLASGIAVCLFHKSFFRSSGGNADAAAGSFLVATYAAVATGVGVGCYLGGLYALSWPFGFGVSLGTTALVVPLSLGSSFGMLLLAETLF